MSFGTDEHSYGGFGYHTGETLGDIPDTIKDAILKYFSERSSPTGPATPNDIDGVEGNAPVDLTHLKTLAKAIPLYTSLGTAGLTHVPKGVVHQYSASYNEAVDKSIYVKSLIWFLYEATFLKERKDEGYQYEVNEPMSRSVHGYTLSLETVMELVEILATLLTLDRALYDERLRLYAILWPSIKELQNNLLEELSVSQKLISSSRTTTKLLEKENSEKSRALQLLDKKIELMSAYYEPATDRLGSLGGDQTLAGRVDSILYNAAYENPGIQYTDFEATLDLVRRQFAGEHPIDVLEGDDMDITVQPLKQWFVKTFPSVRYAYHYYWPL